MMTDDDQLLDADAVANLYSVSRVTVWRWWQAGRIPAPVKQRPMYTRWLKSQVVADIRRLDVEERVEAAT
jgi:predicted DNA-binding transcriptional regulator AlpA